jgi:hypothetical protein
MKGIPSFVTKRQVEKELFEIVSLHKVQLGEKRK